MFLPLLATLTIEEGQEPLRWHQLPGLIHSWFGTVGGFALVGLLIWGLVRLVQGPAPARDETRLPWTSRLLVIVVGGCLLAALPTALQVLWNKLDYVAPSAPGGKVESPSLWKDVRPLYLFFCCALMAVLFPVAFNLPRLRVRRIWALSKLSFKEAIRRRVLWVFSLSLLVFLFASWFFPYKDVMPGDQLRNYVGTVYTVMTWLLLLTAGLLAAFSLPADLRNQTIHTIVTKPVERFEIILGRFLGYTFLMTLVLAFMTLVSLVYVARGIDPEAQEESYKARVPVYGDLEIKGGKNVGYEWEYRKYISGGVAEEYALWTFPTLPRHLGDRDTVRCEFTFDIFRTTKGKEENKGVLCSFVFENWECETARPGPGLPELPVRLKEYDEDERNPEALVGRSADPLTPTAVANRLAEKYHFYKIDSKEIFDFHTLFVDIPAGLFKNLPEWEKRRTQGVPPPLRVLVRCDSKTQYLGVAKHDLYLLDANRGFEQNFFKGAVGLWYRLCLVIGVAVTCSTYLSGVISFLATMFLYVAGLIADFIRTVAEGKAMGGGPLEAFFRLSRREHPSLPLDQSPILAVIQNTDKVFEWLLAKFLNLIPQVSVFDLTDMVAEGFDISGSGLLMNGLVLAGYLLPCLILAFYLMRAREVAA